MAGKLKPSEALYLFALAEALRGAFCLFQGVPPEMDAHAKALLDFFASQCQELHPYGE